MEIIEWTAPDLVPRSLPCVEPAALAIGVFDGVHRGHQQLLRRTVAHGTVYPTVVTFDPNPAAVTRPDSFLGSLSTRAQRIGWFAEQGIRRVVVVRFGTDFARLPGFEFVNRLCDLFPHLSRVVVGFNFHLGRDRDTHAQELAQMLAPRGVHLDIVAALKDNDGSISSSRIRSAVLAGSMNSAAEMLGRPYQLDVSSGIPLHRSHSLQLTPPAGRYRVQCGTNPSSIGQYLSVDAAGHLGWQIQTNSCDRVFIIERISD